MNSTKIISIILCQILLLSVIAFAQSADTPPKEETNDFNPEKILNDNKDSLEELSKLAETLDLDKSNKLLDYIGKNINGDKLKDEKLRLSAEYITQKIITTKAGRELNFKVDEKAKIEGLSISEKDSKNTLTLKIKDKTFNIPLNDLSEKILGINVREDGVAYQVNKEGTEEIRINDPEFELIEEDDKLFLKNYKGLDGDEHKFEISFTGGGRVTIENNGDIEFSGGAVIFDPATKTSFKMKDPAGKPGYINFYKEGHTIRTIGNNMIVGKEDGLSIDIKTKNEKTLFMISKEGITKEGYSDFPSKTDKTSSLLIDPEKKHIYVPEDTDIIGLLSDKENGYRLFGIPNMPQGGILLNGTAGFGGGEVTTTGKGDNSIPGNGGGGGGGSGGSSGGGLGGKLNAILPFLLIGGAILAAALLLGGKKDKGSSYDDQNKSSEEYTNNNENTGYNEEEITTGKKATTKTPTIQSTYDKK